MPFLMAGDPDLSVTAEILLSLQRHGADLVELGIPYSDPLADGPVIQAAASRALNGGTTPRKVIEMLTALKGQLHLPVVLFTYSNPLLSRGMEAFCNESAQAGASGLVVPDLPLEEAARLSSIAADHGLDLALLIAPTTPAERMARISAASRGFIYLVSVTGVTGERANLEQAVGDRVHHLKGQTEIPVAVGFGISGPEQVRQVRDWGADGAIVGSALARLMTATTDEPTTIPKAAGEFCEKLRTALDEAITPSD